MAFSAKFPFLQLQVRPFPVYPVLARGILANSIDVAVI